MSEPTRTPAAARPDAGLHQLDLTNGSSTMNLLHEQLARERMRQLRVEAESSARANRILIARRLARKAQRAESAARRARQAATAVVVW